jgi:hypothetical protein
MKEERMWDEFEWNQRVNKFCPFSRQPCEYMLDPNGKEVPENWAQCRLYDPVMGQCAFSAINDLVGCLMDLNELLVKFLGGSHGNDNKT